jgi:hypothetical protein
VDHGTDDLCQWRVHNEVSSRASFTPDRVAIETTGGQVVAERSHARAGFDGHVLDKPWDWLNLVYFCGYTQCNYLTTPFSFAQPGYLSEELEPWPEDGQTWRRLKVTFPRAHRNALRGTGLLLRRGLYLADLTGRRFLLPLHIIPRVFAVF